MNNKENKNNCKNNKNKNLEMAQENCFDKSNKGCKNNNNTKNDCR